MIKPIWGRVRSSRVFPFIAAVAFGLLFNASTAASAEVALGAAEPTADGVEFFSDGRIMSLTLTGKELVREGRERNGFAVILFDGTQTRTIPLMRATKKAEGWQLQTNADFPRFLVRFESAAGHLSVRLLRAEGVPRGRDSSLVLSLGTRRPLNARGAGVEAENKADSLKLFWKFIGEPEAVKGFGNVEIGVTP